MARAVGSTVRRSDYYLSEAERVQRLADTAEPGSGREQFERVAAEYRHLAEYYDAPPTTAAPEAPH